MIAITGGSGDIGSRLINHFIEKFPIKILIHKNNSIIDKLSSYTNRQSVRFFNSDPNFNLKPYREFAMANSLIHCAALLNNPYNSLEAYLSTNAFLTTLLTRMLEPTANTKFIYLSTEMVYNLTNTSILSEIASRYTTFVNTTVISSQHEQIDLNSLASQFVEHISDLSYQDYNFYALTKYLGETSVLEVPEHTIIRITNAYGPNYTNPRLIPRLIEARLSGKSLTYSNESRHFIYVDDINRLVEHLIHANYNGIVDTRSDQVVNTTEIATRIVESTPTAYGKLIPNNQEPSATITSALYRVERSIEDFLSTVTPFAEGLSQTINFHRGLCYKQLSETINMNEIVKNNEKIIKKLQGSSAAHIYLIKNNETNSFVIRKCAFREGVEGNGISKLSNEILYYQYIMRNLPQLAQLYPRLGQVLVSSHQVIEDLEYLGNGQNFYQAICQQTLEIPTLQESLNVLVTQLCSCFKSTPEIISNSEEQEKNYYSDRALTRLRVIKPWILPGNTIKINNQRYLKPESILNRIKSHQDYFKIFPRIKYFCCHGDLTLLNTVYDPSTRTIRLIDPRGHIGNWDPLYDFSKMKFTLSGFGEIITNGSSWIKSSQSGYAVSFENISSTHLNENFLSLLEQNNSFIQSIANYEPYWKLRILVGEALHYLADIPFRLYIDESVDNAIASYVLGTVYLNQFYKKFFKD